MNIDELIERKNILTPTQLNSKILNSVILNSTQGYSIQLNMKVMIT